MGTMIEFIDYLLEPLHLCLVEYGAGFYAIQHVVTETSIESITAHLVGYIFTAFSPTNFTSSDSVAEYLCKHAEIFETNSGGKIANPYLGATSLDEKRIRRDLI